LESKAVNISTDSFANKCTNIISTLPIQNDLTSSITSQEIFKKNYVQNLIMDDSNNKLDDSFEKKCINHVSTLSVQNKVTLSVNSQEAFMENCVSNIVTDNSDNKLEERRSNSTMNLNIVEYTDVLKENSISNVLPEDNIIKSKMNIRNCISDSYEDLNILSSQNNHLIHLNRQIKENNISNSDKKNVNEYSCKISTQNNSEVQSKENQSVKKLIIFPDETIQFDNVSNINERILKSSILSSDSETIKAFSCNSSIQNISELTTVNHKINQNSKETFKQGNTIMK
jgi:hypothetical protein